MSQGAVHEVGDEHDEGREGKFEEVVVEAHVLGAQGGSLNAWTMFELGVVHMFVGQPGQKV